MIDSESLDAREAAVRAALVAVKDPSSGRSISEAGLIDGLDLAGDSVWLSLRARPEARTLMEQTARQAEAALRALPGIARATVVLTAHRETPAPPRAARAGRPTLLQQTRHIVAVASGKGGVGKSTTAVNLAVALAGAGLAVGLLDADIHGPSLPTMLGTSRRPDVIGDRIQPIAAWGLRAMSIGMMVDQDTAMIWRGPMVMGALEQLLGQVDWGKLDIMVLDLPPGTGDAQLTLTQRLAISGAVIVTTPQDVALLDARRGVRMFEKVGVPILGMIENMSYFCCPSCGTRSDVFGHGGARVQAERLGVPFLGEVPLLLDICSAADAGTPIVASMPDSRAAVAYRSIAEAVRRSLGEVQRAG